MCNYYQHCDQNSYQNENDDHPTFDLFKIYFVKKKLRMFALSGVCKRHHGREKMYSATAVESIVS
jgi:hypothetical protein